MSRSDRSRPQRPRPAIPPANAPRQPAREEPAIPVAISTPPGPTAHELRRMVTETALRADAALQQRERIRSARTRAEAVATRARSWMQDLTRHLFDRSQHDAARSHADAVRIATAQVAQASQRREHETTRLATGLQRVASTTSLANRVRGTSDQCSCTTDFAEIRRSAATEAHRVGYASSPLMDWRADGWGSPPGATLPPGGGLDHQPPGDRAAAGREPHGVDGRRPEPGG